MPLTPDQARKVLEANQANIAISVRDGKPLSAHQVSELSSIAGEGNEDARSVSELADILQVTRQSIYNWKKIEGTPEGMSVRAWREWIGKREVGGGIGTGRIAQEGNHYTTQDIADLRARLLAEQHKRQKIERKLSEIELAKQEQGWISKASAEEAVRRVLEPLARILQNFPKRYSMRINPNNPLEAENKLRECINEVIRQLHAKRGEASQKRKGVK
jgi:hypothetical protein